MSVGAKDELFDVNTAKAEYERLQNEIEICGIDKDWVNFGVHEGGHEVPHDDELIDEMFEALNKSGD